MFVGGKGGPKGGASQVLQGIRKGVVARVSGFPEPVALGEFFRRESGKSQQIVRSEVDHVDSQVVSCVDAKLGAVFISKSKSLHLQKAIKRRVFHPFDLGDVHQSTDRLQVPDLPIRCKHRTQLESQYVRIVTTNISIHLGYSCRRLTVQASGLKQDRYAIKTNDGV